MMVYRFSAFWLRPRAIWTVCIHAFVLLRHTHTGTVNVLYSLSCCLFLGLQSGAAILCVLCDVCGSRRVADTFMLTRATADDFILAEFYCLMTPDFIAHSITDGCLGSFLSFFFFPIFSTSAVCLLVQVCKRCPGNSQDGTWGKSHAVTANSVLLVMQTCSSSGRVSKNYHRSIFSSTLGGTGLYIFCQSGRYAMIFKHLFDNLRNLDPSSPLPSGSHCCHLL